ncbi:hypothetical protein LJR056_007192 [Paenibacillus sp. LjRoot56]
MWKRKRLTEKRKRFFGEIKRFPRKSNGFRETQFWINFSVYLGGFLGIFEGIGKHNDKTNENDVGTTMNAWQPNSPLGGLPFVK